MWQLVSNVALDGCVCVCVWVGGCNLIHVEEPASKQYSVKWVFYDLKYLGNGTVYKLKYTNNK